MSSIRAYRDGDLEAIDPLACYVDDPLAIHRVRAIAESGTDLIYTILGKDSRPLAVVGWSAVFSRVADVWSYTDKRVTDEFVGFSKSVKFLLDHEFEAFEGFHRMQITIRADQAWAHPWATFLGFEQEGVLRKYGEESVDHILFARVRTDK